MENEHWWYRSRRNLIHSLLQSLRKEHGSSLTILDIGCGTGQLMKELEAYGTVTGIDISERAVAYCKERGLSPDVGSADKLPYPDNFFDTVVIMDVLEHLENDSLGAQELLRVLKTGGTAIITVPAFMFLWSVTDELSNHYRRYTRKELVNLLQKNGLIIKRTTYFNTLLFPAIAAIRIIVRLLGIQMKSENHVGGSLINKILYGVFSSEIRLLSYLSFPAGVSILAVAKKD
jgi:ubiquinone/menaquinone biosynthesis C-methylase UbiE